MQVSRPLLEYDIVAPKEAIIAWKHNAVTQQVFDIVRQEMDNSRERIGEGATLGENIIQDTARGVGYIEGLMFLQTVMEIANFLEDKEDAQDERKDRKENS